MATYLIQFVGKTSITLIPFETETEYLTVTGVSSATNTGLLLVFFFSLAVM